MLSVVKLLHGTLHVEGLRSCGSARCARASRCSCVVPAVATFSHLNSTVHRRDHCNSCRCFGEMLVSL